MALSKAEMLEKMTKEMKAGKSAFEIGKKPVAEIGAAQEPAPAKKETPVPATEPAQFEEIVEDKGKDLSENKTPEKAVSEPSGTVFNFDDIGAAARPEKKTYSVYLSTSVMAEIEKRAKKAKLKSSAYLDELLKRVLGL